MAQATETFAVGAEQVTVAVEIDLNTVWLISGDFSGTILNGQIGFINGDVNLIGDLIVEGLLTGIDTFTVEGNGHTIFFQDGGRAMLHGVEKTSWCNWGDPVEGWQVGDRLIVAPTKTGVYTGTTVTWNGDWATMIRPVNSSDVPLIDGRVVGPEVTNLFQSIVFKNLSRGWHIHDGAGVFDVSDVRFFMCGSPGVLASYPIHLHLNGEASRGSLFERVVVDRGRHHAFVPHGTHGVTFKDCVAYGTEGSAFWWDIPPAGDTADTINDANDIVWDHCLALWVMWSASDTTQYTGFSLGAGVGDVCINCVAVAVDGTGTGQRSGFLWGENRSRREWDFRDNLAHNCKDSGIFTWQNNNSLHTIFDFTAYRCGGTGIDHGAYRNLYRYERINLTAAPLVVHAKSDYPRPGLPALVFSDVHSDTYFRVTEHGIPDMRISYLRNSTIPQVIYTESTHPSYWVYEDCDLVPADFRLTGGTVGGLQVRIHPTSIIEVFENSVRTYRWAAGVWT